MKKYMIGLSIAAFSLAFTGCADFLEEPIRGQQDLSEYFKTEDECKQQVTGCYQSLFYDDWWQIQKFYLAGDMCTDDMWMGNTTQDPGNIVIWHIIRVIRTRQETVVKTSGNTDTKAF